MNPLEQVMNQLEQLGSEQTRKTLARHGADPNRMFGVKVGDLKKIVKSTKGNQELALQLYDSGNLDAQYLAGLVADGRKMNKKQLEGWAKNAGWQMISEYTVAWVASENPAGRELAKKWITSKHESVASSGWATYAAIVSTTADADLDLPEISTLLDRIKGSLHSSPNRVRYTMNGFVIAVGTYVKPLSSAAKETATAIGTVHVNMGGTACRVPDASASLAKIASLGRIGDKRKTVRC